MAYRTRTSRPSMISCHDIPCTSPIAIVCLIRGDDTQYDTTVAEKDGVAASRLPV